MLVAEALNWPQAFATVGIAACVAFVFWVMNR